MKRVIALMILSLFLIGCVSTVKEKAAYFYQKAESAKNDILKQNPKADVELMQLDLSSLKSVRQFAERLSEGLEILSAATFDVVLLDLSLPDSSGLNTLAGIQADSPQTPTAITLYSVSSCGAFSLSENAVPTTLSLRTKSPRFTR